MEIIPLLLDGLLLGVVSYFLAWSLHHAAIFENLIAWAEMSDTFIKRIIACPICVTYHIALFTAGIPALIFTWNPGRWFIVWCVACCISLALYSRKFIQSFDD